MTDHKEEYLANLKAELEQGDPISEAVVEIVMRTAYTVYNHAFDRGFVDGQTNALRAMA